MSHLLSSAALVDLAARSPAVVAVVDRIGASALSLSVISVGQATAEVEALPASDPRREILRANLETIVRQIESLAGIRAVDIAVARRWAWLRNLDLQNAQGQPLGTETRLVIATALDSRLALVTPRAPWIGVLTPLGLDSATY